MKILVVEDEIKIANFTKKILETMGHIAQIATTINSAQDFFVAHDFDLVILDVMLPDGSGLELCQKFKNQNPEVPVLILTTLHQIFDKVKGLDSGADDYLTKPFHTEEFSARVRALLRRNSKNNNQLSLRCCDLELDLVKREAKRGNLIIKLTTKEFSLLEYFLRNVGRPVTRAQISQHVWDLHFDPASNIVDVYVKQLRKKIDLNQNKKLIKTVVGLGYVLNDE